MPRMVWTKNAKGNYCVTYQGCRATVFFRDSWKPSELGWIYVQDGDFSEPFESKEKAMEAAERVLIQ